jgi:hypothetical protein
MASEVTFRGRALRLHRGAMLVSNAATRFRLASIYARWSRAMRPLGPLSSLPGDSKLAQRAGRSIGTILAEQHARIGIADVAGWRRCTSVGRRQAIAFAEVFRRSEAAPVSAEDRILIHGDVGFHNRSMRNPIR